MEITLKLQYRIPPDVKWCRLEVAKKLNALVGDALYISPPQVEFKVTREADNSGLVFDKIVAEIEQLIPGATLKMAFMMRSGGRLPVVMYDSTFGRVIIHGYG